MKAKLNKVISAVCITFAIVFSCRVIMVPTALNPAEQVGLICMAIEYTLLKSRRQDEEPS